MTHPLTSDAPAALLGTVGDLYRSPEESDVYQGKRRFHLTEAESVQFVINAFYLVGLLVVGAGQVTGLFPRLGWLAIGAALIIELGGVTFARIADFRRRLGEKAIAARLLSLAFAGLSVAVNWYCHIAADLLLAGILASLSALLYVVFLINSEFRRRDELRKKKKLPPTLPNYGTLWITSPRLTRRAADLFRREPGLGLYGSVDKAREERRTEQRRHAMLGVARTHMTKAFGPHRTALIVSATDPDDFAERLAAEVNVPGLIAVLARRATPEILDASMAREDRDMRRRGRPVVDPTNPTTPPSGRSTNDPTNAPDQPTTGRSRGRSTEPTKTRPTIRPKQTDQHPTNHSPTALRDASTIRADFPHALPPERGGNRLLRDTYRWSNDRANKALAAYVDGADLEVLVAPTTTRPAGGDQ